MSPRIVLQIETLQASRRVWIVSSPPEGRTVSGPTQGLPEFDDALVEGLVCAETPAGRDRILANIKPPAPVRWREVSICNARSLARRLARRTGGVVHLALFDEPDRVVWEPVALQALGK